MPSGLSTRARERLADLFAVGMLDQLADEQIAHIRIRPARTGLEPGRVRIYPREQLADRPGRPTARNRVMIGVERPVIGNARTMLQQLAQRVTPAGKRRVQREPSGIDEHERGGSEHGFSEAPPWDRGIGDIANSDRPVHHGRGHHLDVRPFCAVGIGHPSSLRAV
jgi:hypothetical protein